MDRVTDPYGSETFGKPFYTIKDRTQLIIFNKNITGDSIRVRYEKKPTEMALATDTVTIDDDVYAKSTIPYLAV